jgi:hypothetical protein
MALTPVINGTPNDVIWGTNHLYGSARVISANLTRANEKDLSLNNDGVPTGSVVTKGLIEGTIEIECLTSTTLPAAGATITFNAASYYVDKVDEKWQRKGRKAATIACHSFPS